MTVGERIQAVLRERGMTQVALAKEARVSQVTISKLVSGQSQQSRYLVPIAEALEVSPRWLSTGKGPKHQPDLVVREESGVTYLHAEAKPTFDHAVALQEGPPIRRWVPLIPWARARTWQEDYDSQRRDKLERVPVTKPVSENSFALRIQGDAMEPVFPQGAIIVVDPNKDAANGSYVVACLEDADEATFKQLVIDGGRRYLKPLNPRYPVLELTAGAVIIGTIRHMIMDFD